jgi:DNA-binding NtrC family response regulator
MSSQNGTNKVPHTTRILIVDDEPLMRMALEQALTDSGCEVIEATDAHSATETLTASSPFDVVLLDYQMPDSGDLRLLAAVRSLSPESRVIMMTAHPTAEIVSGARALGATCVLNKPIDIDALCRLVTT